MALIVAADDDPEIREVVTLSLPTHTVIAAADGSEAVTLATERKPDLVILDVMMPRLNGISACKRIRETPALAGVKILMLTAQNKMAEVEDGFGAGADDYLTKPFSPAVLSARVELLLVKKRA